METADDYSRRKWREAVLVRNAPRPFTTSLSTGGPLFEKHAALTAHNVHCVARLYPPSNWTGMRQRKVGDHEFDYGYQRFDLMVRAPAIYPGVHVATKEFYFHSGMAALAAFCQAFDRVAARKCAILSLRDAYFESQHLIDHYCHSLSVKVIDSFAEFASHHHSPFVLHLDSICSESPVPHGLQHLTGCVLAVIDTTCYARTDPIIAQLVNEFISAGAPVLLLRSHVKLDTLGMEIGQLGSAAIFAPPQGAGAQLAQALVTIIPDVIRVFGLAPSPADFFPVVDTADLLELSTMRTRAARANTEAVAAGIASVLPTAIRMRRYHHGLFLTFHNSSWSSEKEVKRLVATLVADCVATGGNLVSATSFGFDFSVVQDVFDVPTQLTAVRLALSDEPVETFGPLIKSCGRLLQ